MHFSRTFTASAVVALANGATISKRALSGEATFYGGNVAGGACSFSTYTLPSGIFGTALSDSNWDGSANCGACVSVTGPDGNSITAMIVDECPGCGTNHLDLFSDAFSSLADPSKGIIPITWDYVDCPISSPLVVHNKEGVSAYWFSLQVVNANKGVSSLEVSTDGGSTWQATNRQDYNFFENSSGFGTTTVDVKVTSVDGDVVTIDNVNVAPGVSVTASSNFGSDSSDAVNVKNAAVAEPEASPAPATTSLPGAVFNEASYSASSTSDTLTTTYSSTTTITRTRTMPKSTSSSTTVLAAPATTYAPANTTSAFIAAALPTANSTTSVTTITITSCIPTNVSSLVPYPETTSSAAAQITTPVANITVSASLVPTNFVTAGASNLPPAPALIATFATLAAFIFI